MKQTIIWGKWITSCLIYQTKTVIIIVFIYPVSSKVSTVTCIPRTKSSHVSGRRRSKTGTS